MGPTATGKTELAIELAARVDAEIISVDSAMVYQGMDIGTAKPGPDVLARVPHHLIDIRDPAERYSAGDFRRDALELMDRITAVGRLPVLVGGTMLYFRALLEGLAELPSADPGVRAAIDREAARRSWSGMHRELERVDPEAAARIHANDPQRIQRALEVYYQSGKPMSVLQREGRTEPADYRFVRVALIPNDRSRLHQAIEARFDQMIDMGFVDEVRRLYEREDLHRETPSMRAVGYRQLWDYLSGKLSMDEAQRRAVVATRRLAKRQMTWLRGEEGLACFEAQAEKRDALVFKHLQEALDMALPNQSLC